MASFVDILKNVGSGALLLEHALAPALSAVYPPFAIVDKLVRAAETAIVGPSQGAAKKQWVTDMFNAFWPPIQDALKSQGIIVTFNGDLLSGMIDNAAAGWNLAADTAAKAEAFKASFKVTKVSQ